MKKVGMFITMFGVGIMIGFGSLAHAEDDMQAMGNEPQQEEGKMGDGQGMKQKMMGMMMHKDSMLATSDGGVVVMSGPRLIKYDKDLNLVKEVELPKGKKPGHHEMKNESTNSEETKTEPEVKA